MLDDKEASEEQTDLRTTFLAIEFRRQELGVNHTDPTFTPFRVEMTSPNA